MTAALRAQQHSSCSARYSYAHQLPGGLRANVGGETAEEAAANAQLRDALPRVVLVMLAVIYLMLLITFRSALLPVKAILMNLLSLGATYGVLVLMFQHGFAAHVLRTDSYGYLQNFVPMLLLAVLFSLSTDYEVFLLSRIREEYRAGLTNTASIAAGLAGTAPLISGAALVMVAVFAAFAFTGIAADPRVGLRARRRHRAGRHRHPARRGPLSHEAHGQVELVAARPPRALA